MAVAILAVAAIGVGLIVWRATRQRARAPVTLPVTLAVLPFENLGGRAEDEYLAAGLTEETGASLAQIDPERLRVKGRALHARGTTKSVAEIGQELAVDYLVASTIRTEDGRVRVTVTLLRVRDLEHLWSQTYERAPASLLGLQQELSVAIAQQVRIRLSSVTPFDIKVSTEDSAGALFMCEHRHMGKGGPVRHLHFEQDEWFYPIAGEFLFEVGDETFRLQPGDSLFAPRRVPHCWACVGDPGTILIALQPAGTIERFFKTLGALPSRPAPETLAGIFAAHGMQTLGPPLDIR